MRQFLMCAAVLLLPFAALAGAKKMTTYDLSTDAGVATAVKDFQFKTELKPKPYPKRVAIGYFQARYVFKQNNNTSILTLKFDDEEYQVLTDMLYDTLVLRLEAEGFEVVDKADVIGAAAYKAIEADEGKKEGGARARFPASGMKNLPTLSGMPKKPGQFAALNAELGTDAVVAAFVGFGFCDMEPNGKTEFRTGFYSCIRGDMSRPGLQMLFIGGAEANGDKVKPTWKARWYKEHEIFEYNKKEKLIFDNALISNWSAATPIGRADFWGDRKLGASEEAFIGGSNAVYADGLTIGFAAWEKKHKAARKAAGVDRPGMAKVKVAAAPGMATSGAPGTYDLPALPGVITCYFGSGTSGDVALRRGVDEAGAQIIEDSITYLPNDGGLYRQLATWTVSGNSATGTDNLGGWTGTAAYEGSPFADGTYTSNLTFGNGMLVATTATTTATSYANSSDIEMGGNPIGTFTQELAVIDEAACLERFSSVSPPS